MTDQNSNPSATNLGEVTYTRIYDARGRSSFAA